MASNGFYISLPTISRNTKMNLLAFLIAIILVFSVVNKFNIATVIVVIVLAVLILIIMHSSRGINYEDSLPSTTYPIPPHLGLDGVSLVNRVR